MDQFFAFPEWLGLLASAFIVASFLLTRLHWIRIVNLSGALLFIVYGVLIAKWPVILPNVFIAIIQLYYLGKYFINQAQK